jgi:Fe-S cluster biosynthesis and repair protein YggX
MRPSAGLSGQAAMASGLSLRYANGVEDSRNPKQSTRQAWIKLIVKVWPYWQAKSTAYINELDREQQHSDIRRRLIRGMICSVS